MGERQYALPVLTPAPPQLAIRQGRFFQIDEMYYQPKNLETDLEDIHSKGRTLRRHGEGVNLKTGFVDSGTPLSLDSGSLQVNYLLYLYQQKTGFDAFHPPRSAQQMRFS